VASHSIFPRLAGLFERPSFSFLPESAALQEQRLRLQMARWCGSGMTDTVRAATGGNVTLYAIDPRGSRNPAWARASAEAGGTRTISKMLSSAKRSVRQDA
jgi:hypothetical protein